LRFGSEFLAKTFDHAKAISPKIVILILIIVALIGAIAVGMLLSLISTSGSDKTSSDFEQFKSGPFTADGSPNASAGQLKLIIDHAKVTEQLTDFPVLIHLSTSSGQNAVDTSVIFTTLGNNENRKKISVTADSEGTQQLFVEIERWDTANKQAWLWVKVPYVASSTNTTLFLTYDPSMPDNTNFVGDIGETAATKVWSNNFTAVYHFSEQGNGTAGEYRDSTGRGNDGRAANAIRNSGAHPGKAPTRSESKIGYGCYFDGASSGAWPCIQIPNSDDFSITTTKHFTMSFWWNAASKTWTNPPVNNSDTFIHPIGKQKDWNAKAMEWQWMLESYPVQDDSPGVSRFYQFSPDAGYGASADSYESYDVGVWEYDTCICDCTDNTHGQADHYFNDKHNTEVTTWQEYGVNYQNCPSPVYVGTSTFEDLEELNNCFYGQIDELEFSNVSRSATWVKASCWSGKDQFILFSNSNK
jgi:Domain of unknown function (DUF2341)